MAPAEHLSASELWYPSSAFTVPWKLGMVPLWDEELYVGSGSACGALYFPYTTTGPFRSPAATTGPAGTFLLAVGPGSLLTAAT